MKKQLFLAIILIFAISLLMAGTPRIYLQRCSLDTGLQAAVTNTGVTTSPDYVVRATLQPANETLGTDLGTPVGSIRISKLGTSPNFYTGTTVQLGTFPTQHAPGMTVDMYVRHIATGEIATWTITIPAGTSTVNIQDPIQVIPPATVASDTYQLTVNSNIAGVIAAGGTAAVGQATPWTSAALDAATTLVGTYSMTPVAGGTWAPASIEVADGDFVAAKGAKALKTKTIAFTWTADPDTYTYNLNVNGPDGYAVTGPAAGTTDYMATDDNAADLSGEYTIGAAPAGWHWAVNPIVVAPADFVLAGKSAANLKAIQGSRDNGAKVNFVYNHTITFELVADPDTYVYNLYVNGPDGYAVTGPVAGTTDYMATDDNAADLSGEYTIAAAPAGWHWVVNPIVVAPADFVEAKVEHVYNATITFVLEEDAPVFDIVAGVPNNTVIPGVTVTATGNLNFAPSDLNNPVVVLGNSDTFTSSEVFTLSGTGVQTLTFTMPAGTWWGILFPGPITGMPFPLNGPGDIVFAGVDFGAKGDVVIVLGDGPADPTLPVELSSFSATLTAQNFVKLTWVSQSETGLLGYRVYRNESLDQATAVSITPVLVPATNTSTTASYSITDDEVAINNTYYYWLESVDMGITHFHGPISVYVEGEVPPVLPEYTTMRNAYPNPFKVNGTTNIEVTVKEGETGSVTVYNILGQAVKTFKVTEGLNPLSWNGRDSKGNVCGSGIYFYKLSTPSMNQTKKMVIVK